MSIPPFDPETGVLPTGEHAASWDDVLDRFGWNVTRRRQLDGLVEALALLAEAGCRRVWLNGSFVTAKDEPGDFDAVWDPDGVDTDRLDPIFFDLAAGRQEQKRRSSVSCFRIGRNQEAVSGLPSSFNTIECTVSKELLSSTRGVSIHDHQ